MKETIISKLSPIRDSESIERPNLDLEMDT